MKKRNFFNWFDSSIISSTLLGLSIVWLVLASLAFDDIKVKILLLTLAVLLTVTAIIIFIKMKKSVSSNQFHEPIVETLFQSKAVALTLINSSGMISELNETAVKMLGYDYREELIGKSVLTIVDSLSHETLMDALEKVKNGQNVSIHLNVLHRSSFPLELQAHIEQVTKGNHMIGYLIVSNDISDHRRNLERIRYMAYYDDMTGLPNRSLFHIRLDEALMRAKEEQNLLGIIYMDLNNFKLVNASFGREYADLSLLQIADRLNRLTTDQDFVARMEGDEFAIIIPSLQSIDELMAKAGEIHRVVSEPYDLKGVPVHISTSMGVAVNVDPLDDSYALFKKADMALLKVKETEGEHILIYSDEWNNSSYERLKLQHEIHRALQKGEFELFYQPQYDLLHGKIIGVEALIRWNHPTKGLLPPYHFIPFAEESGLIVPIGDWVIREACRQNKEWLDMGLPIVPVSVNLSLRQFIKNEMAQQISNILAETGLPAKYLDIEITESMSFDVSEMNQKLKAISDLGVGISVDDFGTGYSSFHYLKSFPISRLKIDRTFVLDILRDKSNEEIVSAIIAMAHKLNLQVIAEGVETNEQLELLRSIQCDEIQGYLKSPPVPGEQFKQFLV